MIEFLREYLEGFSEHPMDSLILGCTHYPLFQNQIEMILGPGVNVVNSAFAVAKNVQSILCLLYTSPSPRDATLSRMPSSA